MDKIAHQYEILKIGKNCLEYTGIVSTMFAAFL
jgi:hypothetical protein